MDKEKKPVTQDNSKDDFDDVLEIMRKRRTKPEYTVPHSAEDNGNISPVIKADAQKVNNSEKAVNSDSEKKPQDSSKRNNGLNGALAETVVIPVASKSGAEKDNSANDKTNASEPKKSSSVDDSSPSESNSATVLNIPVTKIQQGNNVNGIAVQKANQEGTDNGSLPESTTENNSEETADVSKKTDEIPQKPVEADDGNGATRVDLSPVKSNENGVSAPRKADALITDPESDSVSLNDFNGQNNDKKSPNNSGKVKVAFLGSVWFGIIKIVIYLLLVLGISVGLACGVIFVSNDVFAFVKESEIIAEIPSSANASQITNILTEKNMISADNETTLSVTVKKNNSRKLADLLNTTGVLQPLKDQGITKIKINSNTEFDITIPAGADVAVISNLLDTVDASVVKTDIQIVVDIPEGATTKQISKILEDAGVIEYSWVFNIYADYRIDKRAYLTGEYIPGKHVLNPMMNYDKLLDTLSEYERNASGTVRVTIPEGLTVNETIELLVQKGVGKAEDYTEALQEFEYEYKFAKELTPDKLSEHRFDTDTSYRLEGYLFPDTYDFYINENPVSALNKFLVNFDRKFEEEYYERAAELGMTVDEVITLASMIEKEGNNPNDYYYISSVFHNRLKSSEYPYLNSDATLQYALAERTDAYALDTDMEHPYNTYNNKGLPPGPICNPGIQAIDAALYPENTRYYYFYTKKNGETVYSRTYEEHQRYVNADKQAAE